MIICLLGSSLSSKVFKAADHHLRKFWNMHSLELSPQSSSLGCTIFYCKELQHRGKMIWSHYLWMFHFQPKLSGYISFLRFFRNHLSIASFSTQNMLIILHLQAPGAVIYDLCNLFFSRQILRKAVKCFSAVSMIIVTELSLQPRAVCLQRQCLI